MQAPRRRSWIANLAADPHLIVHLNGPIAVADLPATARIVDDPAERRQIRERVARAWRRTDLDRMVEQSPLIEVSIDGPRTRRRQPPPDRRRRRDQRLVALNVSQSLGSPLVAR